jgi:plasmid maintenance system antidote protein VapI
MANEFEPNWIITPREMVIDFIEEFDLYWKDLHPLIQDVLYRDARITPETAQQLALLGGTMEYWIGIQFHYECELDRLGLGTWKRGILYRIPGNG